MAGTGLSDTGVIGVRVAALQLRARSLEEAELALDEAIAGIREAASRKAEIVVLPECTYPAYHLRSLEAWRGAGVRSWRDVTDRIGQVAKETGMYVCMGIAFPGGALHLGKGANQAVLFDPRGKVAGWASKRLLWHFDHDTFGAGRQAQAIATDLGPVGLAICADMRAPEVAWALVSAGARILLDPTALVATGDPTALRNVQLDGLLEARARENGVPIIWADKVGTEDGLVRYVGQSAIMAADGTVLARAGSTDPEVITADVDLPDSPKPRVTVPGAAFPAPRVAHTPGNGRDVFAAVASGTARGAWPGRVRSLRARFAAFPLTPEGPLDASWIAYAGPGRAETSADSHTRSVIRDASEFRPQARIVRFRDLSVGVLFGSELADPRVARSLAFSGADALTVFTEGLSSDESLFWARVRALENRIPLVVVGPAGTDPSWILGPGGETRTATLPGEDFVAAAYLGVLETSRRDVVPGTPIAPVPIVQSDGQGGDGVAVGSGEDAGGDTDADMDADDGLDAGYVPDPEAALARRMARSGLPERGLEHVTPGFEGPNDREDAPK